MAEDLDEKYKRLSKRRDVLNQDKNRIEAELEARKRALRVQMETAKKEGYNPDSLKDDIRKSEEILALKLDNFEAELDQATAAKAAGAGTRNPARVSRPRKPLCLGPSLSAAGDRNRRTAACGA